MKAFVKCAEKYLGTPYKYGGTTKKGLDCSGFVNLAAQDAGLRPLPRTAASIYEGTTKIKKDDLKEGDLVFFASGKKIFHVGIYIGDGKFIHSASDGKKTGVIISELKESFWSKSFYGASRI